MTREITPRDHELIDRALASRGGHLAIGHAGFHLEWEGGWLSGYHCDEMKEACIARGLPVVDNRAVPFGALARIVIGGPMIAVGRQADSPPWHALAHAPLAVVAAACRAVGADIRNIPDADLEAAAKELDGSVALRTAGDAA